MRNYLAVMILLTSTALAGCSGQFWGGTAAGGLGAAGGYEYNAQRQMQRIDDDLKAGRINQEEYNIRKDQIQRGSVLK
jgi:hypothetical protein